MAQDEKEAGPAESRALFVDFMYAVTVGATLPRLDEKVLHLSNPLLWGLIFMIAVFLEDFYLYHIKVVPHLTGFPKARGFILTMLIIFSWYLSQSAFPSNSNLFLLSLAIFFALKLVGGLFMKPTRYPLRQDTAFVLPIVAAVVLCWLSDCEFLASHPERLLFFLAPVWLVTVAIWWITDAAATGESTAGGGPVSRRDGRPLPIWFFVGALLDVYGVLILGAGFWGLKHAPEHGVVLDSLHARIWWGALLLIVGVTYTWKFRPKMK